MGNPKAFLTIHRQEAGYRPLSERITDFGEVEQTLNIHDRKLQASRCMDCGVPFCHWACPTGNLQPEWQDLLYKGKWKEAYEVLESTCDFPEFTGRVCPALCEKSCVLKLSADEPITIRENEASIVETAFREGYITRHYPVRNGKKVAVIGAGPAGLVVANQLNRKGYEVTVYEKQQEVGGLLRYGIPNFKLNKNIIDRRIDLLKEEGINFVTSTEVGKDIPTTDIVESNDAICVCIGAEVPRNLPIEGRELKGVHFALELLSQQNQILEGQTFDKDQIINAKGKKVLIIGGGDTGSDCIGTSVRQGAISVAQIEILPKPPAHDNPSTPWPMYPQVLKTTSSHEEGCERRWNINTCRFIGENGQLKAVEIEEISWEKGENGRMAMIPSGRKEIVEADLAFLAMGFVHPKQEGIIEQLQLAVDNRKNIAINAQATASVAKVFAAGDATTGASLVVRAMAGGRKAAEEIDAFLSNK
ncbi:glutamate synthase subunit beta [uncultured Bacteroides sp.]|uniref:glutamate synthase subunit beta n=1 Tax=uncultured Bacteroides sp. TaxID=162156 RepID=UPI002AAAC406|nr:glutamate synthase subunit beta [uncultured Bacteroides sp.]